MKSLKRLGINPDMQAHMLNYAVTLAKNRLINSNLKEEIKTNKTPSNFS
jgi:hypothetical protein